MHRYICVECCLGEKEIPRKGVQSYILPGPVLNTLCVDKEAKKQAVQFRKKDVAKAGERNK